MKSLVIYHADCADGFGAAFAAWLKLGDEAAYLPMHYMKTDGKTDADLLMEFVSIFNKAADEYVGDVSVYILDFSLPRFVMDWLSSSAARVVWLDHHKTAFEMWFDGYEKGMRYDSAEESPDIRYDHRFLLDDNKSGVMLAWEYFHPGTEVPLFVKHIDDYDRWQFKITGTMEFARAIRSYQPWSFAQWRDWFYDCEEAFNRTYWSDLYEEGRAILRAHDQQVQSVLKNAARKCTIVVPAPDGRSTMRYFGMAANAPGFLASDLGHEIAKQARSFGLVWYVGDDLTVRCSLRSVGDYDVSAIAKCFGGGGHKNAAGFSTSLAKLQTWL